MGETGVEKSFEVQKFYNTVNTFFYDIISLQNVLKVGLRHN